LCLKGDQIYRCFIIWGRNYWVIVIPVLLLLLSFGKRIPSSHKLEISAHVALAVNTITLTSFKNPGVVPENVFLTFLQMVYPVNITQSILTTGLITLKIWMQHARTHSSGLAKVSSNVNLLTIIRIIIESALIFTLQQIILLILQQLDHPAQVILHATLVPSIGESFNE
jgi:hypothetical protein